MDILYMLMPKQDILLNSLPHNYSSILKQGTWTVSQMKEMISKLPPSSPHSCILIIFLLSKYLEEEVVIEDYYPVILSSSRALINHPDLEVEYLADLLIVKQMEINSRQPNNVQHLLQGCRFLFELNQIFKNRYDLTDGLNSIHEQLRSCLFEMIDRIGMFDSEKFIKNDPVTNQDGLAVICQAVLQAERLGVDLSSFKDVLQLVISEAKLQSKITEDFQFAEYQPLEIIAFPPEPLLELKPKPVILEENSLFENLQVLETVYLRKDAVDIRVFKCQSPNSSTFLALKEITAATMKELEAFEQEAYFLKELSGSSQNFLRFFGSRAKTVQIGNILKYKQEILMEYVEKSLKTLKLERIQAGLPFNDDEIKTIYEQLVESFNIMKNKGILHCDIKPSNVLVTDDLVIKVIDFNIARSSISDVTHVTSAFGTRDFMAPEIKKAIARGTGASIKNDKADVFSLGMTILYLLVDKFESDLNDESNLNRLTRLIDSIKIDYIKKPLEKMLEFDYNKRASLNELARVWADTRTISRTVVS